MRRYAFLNTQKPFSFPVLNRERTWVAPTRTTLFTTSIGTIWDSSLASRLLEYRFPTAEITAQLTELTKSNLVHLAGTRSGGGTACIPT